MSPRLPPHHFRPPGWLRRQWLRSYARLLEYGVRLRGQELNLSRVDSRLLVGGAVDVRHYGKLAALGVTAVIDLRDEARDDEAALRALGMELLHLPAPDRHAPSAEQLLTGVRWALPRLAAGGQVYAHCRHGVGRGPMMGAALLIALGQEPLSAWRTVHRARWQAALNDRQLAGLTAFVEAWEAEAASALLPGRVG